METFSINAVGKIRWETEHGRQYIVAPMTLIVPGVLNGSKGPLWYPPTEVKRGVKLWDGIPITKNHPTNPITNEHLSARDYGVLERQGLGFIRKSTFNGKHVAEGWFDAERTKRIDKRIYNALLSGDPLEVSTGLYTENENVRGVAPDGRSYVAIARNYQPDHLAVLPDQTGACSREDGCGVLINREKKWSWKGILKMIRNAFERDSGGRFGEGGEEDPEVLDAKAAQIKAAAKGKGKDAKTVEQAPADSADAQTRVQQQQDKLAKNAHKQQCPECGGDMEDGECMDCGYVENAEAQGKHPKTQQFQGKAKNAAQKGFADLASDDDSEPIEDEDEKIGQGDRMADTRNSNPEGHNQYTDGGGSHDEAVLAGKSAKQAAEKAHQDRSYRRDAAKRTQQDVDTRSQHDSAMAKSEMAGKATDKASTVKGHNEASRAHSEAAVLHREAGNKDAAQAHEHASERHTYAAREMKKTTNEVRNMTRQQMLDSLVTNCAEDADKTALNTVDDGVLQILAANKRRVKTINAAEDGKGIVITFNAKAEGSNADVTTDPATESAQAADETVEDGDDKIAKGDEGTVKPNAKKSFVPAANGKKAPPRTMDELLANASQEDRDIWQSVKNQNTRHKAALVQRLTANCAGDEAKKAAAKVYNGMGVPQLEALANSLPVANTAPPAGWYGAGPSFLGAAGGPEGGKQVQNKKREPLQVLTIATIEAEERAAALA